MSDPTDPTPDPDYGASFADVYDDWYADVTDAAATADHVARLVEAAGGGRVLELGVGSGRLALAMADRGLRVAGIDVSPSMLDLLRAKPGAARVDVHEGDMAEPDGVVDGPFAVVLVAFNTFFNLADERRQRRCLEGVARLLVPGGSLLVEAVVPGDPPPTVTRDLSPSRVTLDRVVLTATEHDPATQTVTGQHVDMGVDGSVRLRPWRIRYATPDQLDAMAAAAGLHLLDRTAGWDGEPFDDDSAVHVSRYGPRRAVPSPA
ncbi:class I SAM-dependent methyltransferase [Actinomarinicola tropica]|uniref:class I SAM-dependent methyltransferase n=1 Tax=Actinomarinicola tropica TaxID=2789776 RepID=UPI001899AF4D|nr:class I SAM-dependent methyltransferase [Actinomarinicola tropica]